MATGDIIAPELKDGHEYHAFIAFSSVDSAIVEDFVKYMQEHYGQLKLCTFYTFPLGNLLLDNISNGMKKSRRAVVFLSKAYRNSAYYDHETLLLIHNNSSHKRQMIIPVCLGLTEDEMKETRLGVYNTQYIDYNQHDVSHKHRIAEAIAGPDIPLSVSLPCGNVAQGLAWSYYYGYIKLILPGLLERCRSSKWANHESIPLIEKVFILIPDSGVCYGTITECDPNITQEGSLAPFYASRGGVINREYKHSIYKIRGPNGEEYFAPCEYATPVMSMAEMCKEGLAGLTENEKRHQILNFRNLLDQILSHDRCQDSEEGFLFKIIFFKADEQDKGNVSSQIVDSIKQILKERKQRDEGERTVEA